MSRHFSLTLFSTQPEFIQRAVAAGVAEIIVDWEHLGKQARQNGADTQINHDTLADLQRVRGCTSARVLCRLNQYGQTTQAEVEQAISAGADEILLPMVRSSGEAEAVLRQVQGRCHVGILVETLDATRELHALAKLPLSRVYVGLNDLAIERKSPSIFTAVADGTLERIRRAFDVPFGFGGLTLPECGNPIPETASLRPFIDREPADESHGQRILWQLLAQCGRQRIRRHARHAQGVEAEHRGKIGGVDGAPAQHVHSADACPVVGQCVPSEEVVERMFAAAKASRDIGWVKTCHLVRRGLRRVHLAWRRAAERNRAPGLRGAATSPCILATADAGSLIGSALVVHSSVANVGVAISHRGPGVTASTVTSRLPRRISRTAFRKRPTASSTTWLRVRPNSSASLTRASPRESGRVASSRMRHAPEEVSDN